MYFKYIDEIIRRIEKLEDKKSKEELRQIVEEVILNLTKLRDYIENIKIPEEEIEKILDTIEGKVKKYGLVWETQDDDKMLELRNKFPRLKDLNDKEIRGNLISPTNILIEGDNLHALYTLSYTHKNKIDLITIDPPYNTKNKDFCYNDRFVGDDDEYRHSKWLSFMEPRLRLAKELLKEDGVIFIHIDDNEFAQLKLLCDEIFGEKNFITSFIWKSRTSLQYSLPIVSSQTEYIFLYAKEKDIWNSTNGKLFNKVIKPGDEDSYHNIDNDKDGPWTSSGIIRDDGRKKYKITTPSGKQYTEAWLYTEENMKRFEEEGKLWYGINGDAKPRKKSYLKDYKGKVSSNLLFDEFEVIKKENGKKVKKKVFEIGTTESGTNTLKDILGNTFFNYPKPVSLLKYFIKLFPNNNCIVLDFFAGSGTTGQAVLELNKEDGGNRQFILCTNNEIGEKQEKELKKKGIQKGSSEWENEGICKKVTYPRLKIVMNGYTNSKGRYIEGLGGNLKYYEIKMEEKFNNFDEDSQNLITKLNSIISIKENVFDVIEIDQYNREFYLLKNDYETKVVGICNIYPKRTDVIKKLVIKLNEWDTYEKILYLPLRDELALQSIKNDYDVQNIVIKTIPKELIDVYDKLNRNLNNTKRKIK